MDFTEQTYIPESMFKSYKAYEFNTTLENSLGKLENVIRGLGFALLRETRDGNLLEVPDFYDCDGIKLVVSKFEKREGVTVRVDGNHGTARATFPSDDARVTPYFYKDGRISLAVEYNNTFDMYDYLPPR